MTKNSLQPKYLKDYLPPAYKLGTVKLHFELDDQITHVRSFMDVKLNSGVSNQPFHLDGRRLKLLSIKLDGKPLTQREFKCNSEHLTIYKPPKHFALEIETAIEPEKNTSLEGLYKSGGNYCTQCEPEGFRAITYFPDHPDVMATYTTTVTADRDRYPVLLSNGNKIDEGKLANNRHWAKWYDPFPKPSYLFALVAGNLKVVEDTFTTVSGRLITLRIYVESGNENSCSYAMSSLKRAMRWDEDTFGLEYDLDIFMIVAVSDFNFGAMENKGLNIFNSKYILANQETATDDDFAAIEAVVAHEYFHNWTGNRVTCRDWFQLSLKEGLTVFRDQEFSSDMRSRAVKRINDVRNLRAAQFPEDAGPLAHAVKPASYIEINNFYTATVYLKGAEVVRMLHTLIGAETFRKGLNLYLTRHDGQAVTTEDFLMAMADASGQDLSQFALWYSQAGTPEITIIDTYDAAKTTYSILINQSCRSTSQQPAAKPFDMPLVLGLLERSGDDLPLNPQADSSEQKSQQTRMLRINRECQKFQFKNVLERPVPSYLRGFSAPVKLKSQHTDEELAILFSYDNDLFNRWEAGQQLAVKVLLSAANNFDNTLQTKNRKNFPNSEQYVGAIGKLLREANLDQAFFAEAITLPTEAYICDQMDIIDVEAAHWAREHLRKLVAEQYTDLLLSTYHEHKKDTPYTPDASEMGRRSLKNRVLYFLAALDQPEFLALCKEQYFNADNMTDRMAALGLLVNMDNSIRDEALVNFYRKWQNNDLVVDKWFALQARSSLARTLDTVARLTRHEAFSFRNPNRVRALIGAFTSGNGLRFHRSDGAGYRFLSENVLVIDKLNPLLAARLLAPFGQWRRFDVGRQKLITTQIKHILHEKGISKGTYEIAFRILKQHS